MIKILLSSTYGEMNSKIKQLEGEVKYKILGVEKIHIEYNRLCGEKVLSDMKIGQLAREKEELKERNTILADELLEQNEMLDTLCEINNDLKNKDNKINSMQEEIDLLSRANKSLADENYQLKDVVKTLQSIIIQNDNKNAIEESQRIHKKELNEMYGINERL